MERDSGKNLEREKVLGTSGVAGALSLLAELHALGLRTVVICPGGRNAPMLQAIEASANKWSFEVLSFFDERAAAFFALGRSKRDGIPVLVSVTSGTAVAQLMAAAIEAHATNVPLVFVTADRPRDHRGTGSPQSMVQVNIFGDYAPTIIDWQEGEELPQWCTNWNRRRPIHINLCHDEPLWSKNDITLPMLKNGYQEKPRFGEITTRIPDFKQPLVLVGSLQADEVEIVKTFCRWYQAPVLAEASSGIREAELPNMIHSADRVARRWLKRGEFDGVIRFGGVPSWRLWRDLEKWHGSVVSFGRTLWSGLPGRSLTTGELESWLERWMKSGPKTNLRTEFHQEDRLIAEKREKLLLEYPQSEAAFVRQLSIQVPPHSMMYLGNSRPVRDWNEHALFSKPFEIQENRGLNGIDGQVSSFLGHARTGIENWALLGDLTFMYDMQGLWALRHLSKDTHTRLVVMNNSGGQIFKRMFPSPLFLNSHEQSLKSLADFWQMSYSQKLHIEAHHAFIELIPSQNETEAFKNHWEKL